MYCRFPPLFLISFGQQISSDGRYAKKEEREAIENGLFFFRFRD